MRYLSLVVIPVALALLAPARRPGRHDRRAAPEPSPTPARSSRVRPYASRIPVTEPPPAYEVPPRAAMVRPYVLDTGHRARCAEERRRQVDQQRLGLAVLMDLGRADPMWHCPVSGCQMAAPYPTAHPCPLTGTAPEVQPAAPPAARPVLEGAR